MTQSLFSSEMLARIIDGSPIPSFVIDKQHKVTHWNTAIEAISGVKKEQVIGTGQHWRAFYAAKRPTMADLIVNGAPAKEIEAYYSRKCRRSRLIEGAYEAEDFFPDLGENGRWLHFTASPIRDSQGVVLGAIETLEDITTREETVEALHNSEQNFRALFENAHDAIWVTDLKGNIKTANKASAALTGYSVGEILRRNVKSFLGKESRKLASEVRDKLIENQPFIFPYEQKLIKKDGSEATCMVTTNLITKDSEITGFQNIARDVTEEKRMQENLRYYLQEITRAQEEERRRIARELHDDTTQVLGSLSRQLDNFVRKEHNLTPKHVLVLEDLRAQLNRGAQDLHRFSQALRLSVLDDLGLIPALRSLIKSVQEYNGIATDLKVVGKERRFSAEVELLLFRIVQEALNNVVKHAKALGTKVVLEFGKGRIKLTISDNGQGFEPTERIDDLPRSGKLGLAGIQERARLIGGTLEVKSKTGVGTSLIVEVTK
ncbi:PAS domain S-box protein [Chloroflexota bacterium]